MPRMSKPLLHFVQLIPSYHLQRAFQHNQNIRTHSVFKKQPSPTPVSRVFSHPCACSSGLQPSSSHAAAEQEQPFHLLVSMVHLPPGSKLGHSSQRQQQRQLWPCQRSYGMETALPCHGAAVLKCQVIRGKGTDQFQ